MATADFIAPFPAHIDRSRFGDYLSGLTAGEGYFLLYLARNNTATFPIPWAQFGMSLRDDDRGILGLIQSYFGCGKITYHRRSGGANRQAQYRIHSVTFLAERLVPHFEAHPLIAKKANDFAIWKQGVLLINAVSKRPSIRRGRPRAGSHSRWTTDERDHFTTLVQALKDQRIYQSPQLAIPALQHREPENGLFS
jgi:hypothetical protein